VTEFGNKLQEYQLDTLPLANVAILENQMSNMKKTKRNDLCNGGGQGDLQHLDLQELGN
jgi:hypothetical protein